MPNEMIASCSYISTARAGLADTDFQAILDEANERNATLGLTGLLAFNGLNFMQTLEGARQNVYECIRLIEMDRRHNGMVIFDRREIRQREFSGWTMAGIRMRSADKLCRVELDQLLSADGVRPETRKNFQSFQSYGRPAAL